MGRPDRRELARSEARYRTLVRASALDVWRADAAGALVVDMPGWREHTRQEPEDLSGDGWLEGIHPDDREWVRAAWYEAVSAGAVYEAEYRIRAPGGEDRVIFARGVPVFEAGEVVEWIGTSTDVTEQRRAVEDLREQTRIVETLNEIGMALAAELDLETLVQALTDATTELAGAEFGAFFYTGRDGGQDAFALYTLSGASKAAFESFPMPRATPVFAPTFAGEGPVRIADVTADPRYGQMAPYHGMPPGHLPVRSYLAVPVVARSGHVHGGLFFGHGEPGVFTEHHERLVVGVAAQAAVALDNARLFEAERAARADAERANRQLELLAAASDRFVSSLDAHHIAEAAVRTVVPSLADWAAVYLLSGADVQLVALDHVRPEGRDLLVEIVDRYPVQLDTPHGAAAAMRTGVTQHLPEISADIVAANARDDEHLALLRRLPYGAGVAIPLAARGRVIGAVSLYREKGGPYGDADVAFAEELARRAALALDNAILYAHERSAALTLQSSLLPRLTPSLPGAACATRYLPGAAGAEVGGDWYDATALDTGAIAVAVGDVQGRGVAAAAVMGQLRSAVRAYALEDHEPGEVMARVNRLLGWLDEGPLATCIFCTYDPESSRLTAASAGHLPPLVVDAGGTARFVPLDPGLPLGVADANFAPSSFPLEAGGLLVLYTDGLVEAPAEPLEEGMARLAAAAADAVRRGLAVEEAADFLLAAMGRTSDHPDDIALLVLAPGARERETWVELSDDPQAVRTARRAVDDAVRGSAAEPALDAATLLVSEIVTNAVRHASSVARMRVRASGTRLRVEVFDDDVGALPMPRSMGDDLAEQGRGLLLVDALADAWGVEATGAGKCVWFEMTAREVSSTAHR